MFEFQKCSLTVGGSFKDSSLLGKVMQRLHLSGKVVNECAIIASKTAERAYFGDASRSRPRSDSDQLLRVALDPMSAYDVTKERDLTLKKTTHRWFELERVVVEPIEHSS